MIICRHTGLYSRSARVLSLVDYPPLLKRGDLLTIDTRWRGFLYAVRLPNGDLYKWLNRSELSPVDPNRRRLQIGDFAAVIPDRLNRFRVEVGDVVQILNIVETDYYTAALDGQLFQGWLAGFELAPYF